MDTHSNTYPRGGGHLFQYLWRRRWSIIAALIEEERATHSISISRRISPLISIFVCEEMATHCHIYLGGCGHLLNHLSGRRWPLIAYPSRRRWPFINTYLKGNDHSQQYPTTMRWPLIQKYQPKNRKPLFSIPFQEEIATHCNIYFHYISILEDMSIHFNVYLRGDGHSLQHLRGCGHPLKHLS